MILALRGLKYFLDYGKEITISYEYKNNIVQRQIELLNGVSLIEKCAKSKNSELSELANEVLTTYFSKDESNNLNN